MPLPSLRIRSPRLRRASRAAVKTVPNVLTLRPAEEAAGGACSPRRLELSGSFHAAKIDIVGIQEARGLVTVRRSTVRYRIFSTACHPGAQGG